MVYVPMAVVAYGLLVRLSWGLWTYLASDVWPFPATTFWQHLLLLWLYAVCVGMFFEKKVAVATLWGVRFFIMLLLRSGFNLTLWQPLLFSLGKTAVQASFVWAVPGLVLGGVAPLLRRPSQLPWIWSPLAFVTAVICMIMALAFDRFWLLVPALILVVASVWFWFRRHDRLEDLWPLLATCGALIAFGLTTAVHEVTSLGVYAHLNTVINPPRRPVAPSIFGAPVWALVLGDEDRTLDEALEALEPMPLGEEKIQKLRHLEEQVQQLKDQRTKQPPAWHEFQGMERQEFQQRYLQAMQDYLQERRRFEQTLLEWAKNDVPQWFELALIGSLSFWATFGLLAVWNIAERRPPLPMP